MKISLWPGARALALGASLLVAHASTHASTLTWNVTGDGTWDTTTANWTGDATTFTSDGTVDVIFSGGTGWTINVSPDMLPHSTTVSGDFVFTNGPIDGGALTKNAPGMLRLKTTPANFTSTTVNGGTLYVYAADDGFSPNGASFNIGNVTVNTNSVLRTERANIVAKPGTQLTMNGGRYFEYNGWGGSWSGPIYLAADSYFGQSSWCCRLKLDGNISGPGGLTYDGYSATWPLVLTSSNSYTGPTIVTGGTLECDDPDALGNGGALTVASGGAQVNLNYTGDHVVSALTLGGVSKPAGTYGSTNSAAPAPNQSAYFAGTGTVTVPGVVMPLILSFGLPNNPALIDSTAKTITWYQPYGTDITHLAPTYEVNSGTGTPASGSSQNFSSPVTYTVANQWATNNYVVTVTVLPNDSTLVWNTGDGTWDYFAFNWKGATSGSAMPFFAGAQVLFTNDAGGQIGLADSVLPGAILVSGNGTYQFNNGTLQGGWLTNNGPGQLSLYTTPANLSGVVLNGGTLYLRARESGGYGHVANINNVTVNTGATVLGEGALLLANAGQTLTMNGGRWYDDNGFGDGGWTGPITLASDSYFGLVTNSCWKLTFTGQISGPGGFTCEGWTTNQSRVTLVSSNSYRGNTTVSSGTLVCQDPGSLGGGGALNIADGALVSLNYTGDHYVSGLTLGGVAQTLPGTYGSSSSGATYPDDTHFSGTGTVNFPGPARLTYFAAAGSVGVIDQGALTVTLSVPYGTSLAAVAPSFALTSGTCNQPSGSPPAPTFAAANPATYTLIDGTTTNQYAVTVVVLPPKVVIPLTGQHLAMPDLTLVSPVGALPAGSILTNVTIDAQISWNNPYVTDICLLFAASNDGSNPAMRITNDGDGGSPAAPIDVLWQAALGPYSIGTPITASVDTNSAPPDGIAPIDLGTNAVLLTSGYPGGWTGTITLYYTPATLPQPPVPELPPGSFSLPGGVPTFTGIATVSNYTYSLVYKNDLTDPSWTRIGSGVLSTGNPITLTDPSPNASHRFYRIEAR